MIAETRETLKTVHLVGLIVFFSLFLFPSFGRADQGPAKVIADFNEKLLEVMKKADDLGYQGRYKLLAPVIRDSFALSFMGGQSLGRYGKTLNDEQKRLFLKAYDDWTVATYAGRFDGYSGERFEVVPVKGTGQGPVTVISKLIKSTGEAIEFHYLMRKIEGGWRVVDIQISGVSQLALTRSQFAGVLKDKGIEGLMTMLKEKIRNFAAGKGK